MKQTLGNFIGDNDYMTVDKLSQYFHSSRDVRKTKGGFFVNNTVDNITQNEVEQRR